MEIKKYDDMNSMQIDAIREIGSIGTGNAVSALSSIMNTPIKMDVPTIKIEEFDDVVYAVGSPEDVVMAVLVTMSGEMDGIMMFLVEKQGINEILGHVINENIEDLFQISEMGISALTEVGNIMISSYVNAISQMANIDIELSVPAMAVNMLGGILSVPMAELGYETDKLMMIDGSMTIDDKTFNNTILMLPRIKSLNVLMEKLVGIYG